MRLWLISLLVIGAYQGVLSTIGDIDSPKIILAEIGEPVSIELLPIATATCRLHNNYGQVFEYKQEDPELLEAENIIFKRDCNVDIIVNENSFGIWTLQQVTIEEDDKSETIDIVKRDSTTEPPEDNGSSDSAESGLQEPKVLEAKIVNTELDETVTITIRHIYDHETVTCHARTPSNIEYNLEDVNIPGVAVNLVSSEHLCGVTIELISEDLIGDWILIAKETRLLSQEIVETRQPFSIRVERIVESVPNKEVVVLARNEFHLRLLEPTDLHETCTLSPSNPQAASRIERDARYEKECGFIVSDITMGDSGVWEIVYGTKVTYKASVELTVREPQPRTIPDLYLLRNRAVYSIVGPEDAVYCRIIDPRGVTVFDKFRRCVVELERATDEHTGTWTLHIGLPGKLFVDSYHMYVRVMNPDPAPLVEMATEMTFTDLTISCTVTTTSEPQICKFLDPYDRLIIAQQGVGEGRYSFNGTGVSKLSDTSDPYNNNTYTMDCGLRISSPSILDLGIWRCGVETLNETHYGFHTVVCPWLMMDETLAASVQTEPVLRSQRPRVTALTGENMVLSCSISASIRYCYFRSNNGAIFTVTPGVKNDRFEYIGSGFDAGECGLRMVADTPQAEAWSCHVGLTNTTIPEQSASFSVFVQDPITALQYRMADWSLVIEARAHDGLDYCRFIRDDGFGFTNDLTPEGYVFHGVPYAGTCRLYVPRPTAMDLRRWIVAGRVSGQQVEISARTLPYDAYPNRYPRFFFVRVTILIICIGVLLLCIGLLLGPKKNRKWTYARASAVRNSLRRSFQKKKPVVVVDSSTNNSPQAA